MSNFNSIYSNAIIINGPDQYDVQENHDMFSSRINNVISIGDGKKGIMDDTANGIYQIAMQEIISQDCFQSPLSRTLVVINAHGNMHEGRHVIQLLEDGGAVLTEAFFSSLAETITTPFDILFTPCFGGGAITDIDKLPQSSKEYAQNKIHEFCADDSLCETSLQKSLDNINLSQEDLLTKVSQPKNLVPSGIDAWKLLDALSKKHEDLNCEEHKDIIISTIESANQVLVDGRVPLKADYANLCKQLEKDDNDDEEEDESWLEELNDFAVVKSLEFQEIFVRNTDFPYPEKSDFGSYLLISSFIQDYCNHNPCPELM